MSDNKFHIRNIIEFAKLYDEDKESRIKSIESLISLLETINSNRDKILIDGYYKTKVGNYEGRISFRAEWGGKVLILTKIRCVVPDGENKPKIYSYVMEGSLKTELDLLNNLLDEYLY
jgi:hypothetical protein